MLSSPVYAESHPRPPVSHPRLASPCFSHSRRLDVRTFRGSDDLACHQIPSAPVFSSTYKLPIFYPLCFDIHPCNGGGVPPSSQFNLRAI